MISNSIKQFIMSFDNYAPQAPAVRNEKYINTIKQKMINKSIFGSGILVIEDERKALNDPKRYTKDSIEY